MPGHPLPRDRRSRAARAAAGDARWQRPRDGALDGVGHPPDAAWETDLSSQTGASQAGILLGSNEDIPAFRWVEKETGRLMTCSAPARLRRARAAARHRHRAPHQRRREPRQPALRRGRGVHPDRQPDDAEKRANPGYRAFFANGHNVTRALALFFAEVFIEWTAALRAIRRDVLPRGHRGGIYPFMRAAMCVIVRDLIVHGVLTDMMARAARHLRDLLELRRGRPPLRAGAVRHARGAAQARQAVRPDRAGPQVRAAPVRDRGPLRPRPDAGRDVPAAQRLRAPRARRSVARERRRDGDHGWRRERRDGRHRVRRGHRPHGTKAPAERWRIARWPCSGRATSA